MVSYLSRRNYCSRISILIQTTPIKLCSAGVKAISKSVPLKFPSPNEIPTLSLEASSELRFTNNIMQMLVQVRLRTLVVITTLIQAKKQVLLNLSNRHPSNSSNQSFLGKTTTTSKCPPCNSETKTSKRSHLRYKAKQ